MITTALGNLDTLSKRQKELADEERKLALASITLQGAELKRTYLNSIKNAFEQGGPMFSGLLKKAREDSGVDLDGDGSTESSLDYLFSEGTARDKLELFKGMASEFEESLKAFGPEGTFIASISTAAFTIADSYLAVGEAFKETEEKGARFAAVASAVGASIGAVNQMMQAGYQANIAKIDEQIEAEKRRDGKSKESVERINKLEKKKEQQQRKAFEMNKKMLMAQTIANTAAGIAGVLSGIRDPFVSAPLAITMAAIIGAMGAAQLAVIAGTSFQGGGASISAGTPSSITSGQRRSSVDLAKSQGASGELSYLRGAAGTGGPENFRGAFAGMRYRAEGGNTGLVVGEQGPELFVPETPGRIVPNDDIGSSNQNINFSINAVDAAGVEELLVNQRGNIIGMLREASNSYGQPFMEKVNTQVYSSQGGVSRYGDV